MSAPPPPPPPLPPPPPAPQSSSVSRGIPPQCHPNSESLMILSQSSKLFDKSEQKELSETPTGKQLQRVMYQCRAQRENYTKARKAYEEDRVSKDKQLQVRKDVYVLQSCLSARACPERYQPFAKCWARIPPAAVDEFKQAGMIKFLCLSEREAVERCTARLVSSSVRLATAEDGLNDDDIMVI